MLTLNELCYGKSASLPQLIPLRAGPLTLLYEDGDLRCIKLGEDELVRRIYAAIRDRNWGTILPKYSNTHFEIGSDRFYITYEVDNQLDDIHFNWRSVLQGTPDGTLTFRMEGQAVTTFLKNRIGLCVLHPANLAGKPCTVTQVDGSQHKTSFPPLITPDQPPLPFTDMTGLSYAAGPVQVEISLDGEAFEMEDQRNWSDASFKTFCTPLRFPYPVEILAGTKVTQTITIRASQSKNKIQYRRGKKADLTLDIGTKSLGRLPSLGTGIASHKGEFTSQEITRLKALGLSHLRADIWLSDPLYAQNFNRAGTQSRLLGLPLYLALHVTANGEAELRGLEDIFHLDNPQVALWLVYPASESYQGASPTAQVLAWVKDSWIARLSKSPTRLASGTDSDFIFLLRNFPPVNQIEAVCFAVNPQVHTFDNASIMETLETQAVMVANARELSGQLPVVVSPVTLCPRYNPYATGVIPTPLPGELPPQVDYRQPSLFTAAWLVGSLRALAWGKASAVTYFETTGWRGLMETEAGSPVPGKFRSIPGAVFPLYHILADIAEFVTDEDPKDVEVLAVESTDGRKVQGLALRRGKWRCILAANLTPDHQTVTVRELPNRVAVRYLDESNVEEAMRTPEVFRSKPQARSATINGKLEFGLLPYAVARLDIE
jgi:hypothetical protein